MMKESAVDVILHPVRIRIIQYLINQTAYSPAIKRISSRYPSSILVPQIKKIS